MARLTGFEGGRSGMQPDPLPVGVWGDSATGMGVFGTSGQVPEGTTPPEAQAASVVGISVQNPGIVGRSTDNPGVLGQSQNNPGVLGVSFSPDSSDVTAASLTGGDGVSSFVGDANAVLGTSRRTGTGAFGGNFRGLSPDGSQELPATGIGVDGLNRDTGTGVRGYSPDGEGVRGNSSTRTGVIGMQDVRVLSLRDQAA